MKNLILTLAVIALSTSSCTFSEGDTAGTGTGPAAERDCADDLDNDGDSLVDSRDPDCQAPQSVDVDGDGRPGDPAHQNCVGSLIPATECDCNDGNALIHPGSDVVALCADGFHGTNVDVNCDGTRDCPPDAEACRAGACCTDVDCADGDACTTDTCTVSFACTHIVPADAPDACRGPACARNADCADGDDCTSDRCLIGGVCDHERLAGCGPACASDSDCSDGLFCSGRERCVGGACVSGAPPSCSDGLACTSDLCSEASGSCTHTSDDRLCGVGEACNLVRGCVEVAETPECRINSDCEGDDSFFCTVNRCVANRCVNVPNSCDDLIADTDDSCSEAADRCVNTPRTPACRDADCQNGLFCDGAERCSPSGTCIAGTPPSCDDALASTTDSCDEASDSCRHVAAAVEICDGADNDGDMRADNGFDCVRGTQRDCTYFGRVDGIGRPSTRVCGASCTYGDCLEPTEFCDGADNDGDGLRDEGFDCARSQTRSCTAADGRSGTQTCGASCTYGLCEVAPATRRIRCSYVTEGSVTFDRINVNGCYGQVVGGVFVCEGPSRDASGNPTWSEPIPGCSSSGTSSVICTVDVPAGRRLRFNPHMYNFGGSQFYGCDGLPNADRAEDQGDVTCTVDGTASAPGEVATPFGGGCNLEIVL